MKPGIPDSPSKIVLITGASSGIGWETAKILAGQNCLLSLAARRLARLEALSQEVMNISGVPPLVLPTDLKNPAEVLSMVKKTHDHYGRIDVLINNAGVLFMEPFLSMPLEDMESIMDTNFWPLVHAIRAAAVIMGKQGGGHVINVGSGVSRRGLPYMAVYAASKFALAGLTESIRVELAGHGVHFTTVYPGGVETEMPNKLDRSKLPADYEDHSAYRVGPSRVARAIAKAVRRRPLEVYVPWWVRFFAWAGVLCPGLVDAVLTKRRP